METTKFITSSVETSMGRTTKLHSGVAINEEIRMTNIRFDSIKIEAKWALIQSLMYMTWMLAERLAGLHDELLSYQMLVTPFILVPSFVIYLLALREKKRRYYGGYIRYKQAFLSGMLLSLFIVLLCPLYLLISTRIISPEYFSNLSAFSVAAGTLTPEEAVQQLSLGNYIIQSVIGGLVTGALFSAILSFFLKSREISHE